MKTLFSKKTLGLFIVGLLVFGTTAYAASTISTTYNFISDHYNAEGTSQATRISLSHYPGKEQNYGDRNRTYIEFSADRDGQNGAWLTTYNPQYLQEQGLQITSNTPAQTQYSEVIEHYTSTKTTRMVKMNLPYAYDYRDVIAAWDYKSFYDYNWDDTEGYWSKGGIFNNGFAPYYEFTEITLEQEF